MTETKQGEPTLLTITAKLPLDTTPETGTKFEATQNAFLNALNYVSQHAHKTGLTSKAKLQNDLYTELRTTYGLKAQLACSVCGVVAAKYKARKTAKKTRDKLRKRNKGKKNKKQRRAFKNKPIRFKKPQCELVYGRDYTIDTKRCEASINTIENRVKHVPIDMTELVMQCKRYGIENYEFGTAHLMHKNDKWFLYVPITFEIPEQLFSTANDVIGVDRGLRFIVAAYRFSDGARLYIRGGRLMAYRAQVREKTQELKVKKTRSARKRLASMRGRESSFASDTNHQASKALAQFAAHEHTVYGFEDLTGIREVTEVVRRDRRYIQVSWGFADLFSDAEYKLLADGHSVVLVDPAYTSQRCPRCEHVSKRNRRRKYHEFRCERCNFSGNDDGVAAINVGELVIRNILFLACGCGSSSFRESLTQSGVAWLGGGRSMLPNSSRALPFV